MLDLWEIAYYTGFSFSHKLGKKIEFKSNKHLYYFDQWVNEEMHIFNLTWRFIIVHVVHRVYLVLCFPSPPTLRINPYFSFPHLTLIFSLITNSCTILLRWDYQSSTWTRLIQILFKKCMVWQGILMSRRKKWDLIKQKVATATISDFRSKQQWLKM